MGEPTDEQVEVGPLVSKQPLERVTGFVNRARQGGARMLIGSEPMKSPGFFYKPSVITDVAQDAEIIQREGFGPVVTVHFTITAEMPHGGYKRSGYGKDMSVYAIEQYTQVKHVMAGID